jgi:hypothetical protein
MEFLEQAVFVCVKEPAERDENGELNAHQKMQRAWF